MSLADIIENYQASFVPPNSVPRSEVSNPANNKFARRDFPVDPRERRLHFKLHFLKKLGEQLGQLVLKYDTDEKELNAIKEHQGQITQAALDGFVYSLYNPPQDPGMGWIFANNFPEQRQRMIDLLNLKHDIIEQLMILKTKSFPDKEDALLLFYINSLRPMDRQRFLTWLVGNDRSKDVLNAIVGLQPTFKFMDRGHAMVNSLVVNLAGTTEYSVDDTGNYPDRGIPPGLWSKMSNDAFVEVGNIDAEFAPMRPTNMNNVKKLFSQFPLRGRNDYSLPTPYTSNTVIDGENTGRKITFAPVPENLRNQTPSYYSSPYNTERNVRWIVHNMFN
jgi:hypothetical protein